MALEVQAGSAGGLMLARSGQRRRPLNVLVVGVNGNLGGAERVALEMIEGLDPRCVTATVVAPAEGRLTEVLRQKAIPVFVVPATRWLGLCEADRHNFRHHWEQLPDMVAPLLDIIRSRNIDVVYACTATVLHAGIAALLARRPLVQHFQDILHHPDALIVPFRSPALTYRFLGSLSAIAVCVGTTVRKDVGTAIPGAKVRIVPLGFRPPGRPVAPMALPGPPDATRVGIVGRISQRKGIADIAEIVRRVCAASPDVHFYWVGSGPSEVIADLRANGPPALSTHLHFLGFHDDVWPFMHTIDFLLHPSRIEAFPRVLIEAALAGRPAVATRCGGSEEIIQPGETGLLAPMDDVDALAGAVLQLASNSVLRGRLGEKARQAAGAYSMDAYQRGMQQCIRDADAIGPAVSSRWAAAALRGAVYAPSRINPVLRRLGVPRLLRSVRAGLHDAGLLAGPARTR